MSLMNFAGYNSMGKAGRPEKTTVLAETLNGSQIRSAALGMLAKMSQLHQRVDQDSAQKSIADMLFVLSSMLALAIGSAGGDPELVNHARSSVSR